MGSGALLSWFESFLTTRQQSVICAGKSSSSSLVTSGVPQGTVLGPLLFLLYINDLPDGLNSSISLFADDALLYGIISNDADSNKLQDDLLQLERWQNKWQMNFNPSKCKIICFSTKQEPPQKTYVFCGTILEQVESIPYLGVTLDHQLKWSNHISNISRKANKTLGMIKRNLWNCPQSIKETTYKTIVRPKLEYACESWDPYYKKDIATLERIQRKAARFCTQNYQQTASVTHMLGELGWETLQARRKKARLTMIFKLSHNLLNLKSTNYLKPHTEMRTRGSHPFKYFIPNFHKDVFKYSFFPRTIMEWNSLPPEAVTLNSISLFKSTLNSVTN